MARLHIHPLGLGLIFFGLLAWVIALGGIGASTSYCQDNKPADDPSYCGRIYQLEWWSVWFEFLLLLIMLLTCFTNAFDRARFIYLTYLAMVTVLLTMMARNFITSSFSSARTITGIKFGDRKTDANNAAAAGAVLLCITNYALIIFVGLGAAQASSPQSQGYTNPGLSMSAIGTSLGLGMGTGSTAPAAQPQIDKYQPSNF